MMLRRARVLRMLGLAAACGILPCPGGSAVAVRSATTEECVSCHASVTPGIVADWERSRHAETSPAEALGKPAIQRRMSAGRVPEVLAGTAVGCAECHMLRGDAHQDNFDHLGYEINVVVSPGDCAVCHPEEADQFAENLMSHARSNLADNSLYHGFVESVNGVQSFEEMKTTLRSPDEETNLDSCYFCHGSQVKVEGTETRETALGELEFPLLLGWPNQGTGRMNPDGTAGSCTACHTRHQFSIEMARKPHTCSECHKGPDVPAYKVYQVSKHGNIFSAMEDGWNWEAVPWTVGKDFSAPTCAGCHVSLLVNGEGETVAERTHRMNDRLEYRIFGLPYAHPHPRSADTTIIRNRAGLPLPTELSGEPAAEFVIDGEERAARRARMQQVCRSCHAGGWVEGHFERLDNTIRTTNEMTLAATKILSTAWERGLASGLPQGESIFDEHIEKLWVEQWLFYANSTRFASAMAGADYGVFANGRWYLSRNLAEMFDWLQTRTEARGGAAEEE